MKAMRLHGPPWLHEAASAPPSRFAVSLEGDSQPTPPSADTTQLLPWPRCGLPSPSRPLVAKVHAGSRASGVAWWWQQCRRVAPAQQQPLLSSRVVSCKLLSLPQCWLPRRLPHKRWGEMMGHFVAAGGAVCLALHQSRGRAFAPQPPANPSACCCCGLVCRFKKELKKRTIPAEDYSELGKSSKICLFTTERGLLQLAVVSLLPVANCCQNWPACPCYPA
jgi:hypothetical protein